LNREVVSVKITTTAGQAQVEVSIEQTNDMWTDADDVAKRTATAYRAALVAISGKSPTEGGQE